MATKSPGGRNAEITVLQWLIFLAGLPLTLFNAVSADLGFLSGLGIALAVGVLEAIKCLNNPSAGQKAPLIALTAGIPCGQVCLIYFACALVLFVGYYGYIFWILDFAGERGAPNNSLLGAIGLLTIVIMASLTLEWGKRQLAHRRRALLADTGG